MLEDPLEGLGSSVVRLRTIVADLDDGQLGASAYPSEWTVADVLSHLGSGAVIMGQRLERALLDQGLPADFGPSVWEVWDAKSPRSKSDDALAADRNLLERIESLSAHDRARVRVALGPLQLDFDGFVRMRLTEHAMHTWDVEVVAQPTAPLADEVTPYVLDNLEAIIRFAAKPTGSSRTIAVRTVAPRRDFTVTLVPDGVTLTAAADGALEPDLELPAEAFARLIYGRLDPGHTPAGVLDEGVLDELRRVFAGV